MPYLSTQPIAASENAGFADFVVRLDAPAVSEIRVSVQLDNGTAVSSQDFTFLRDTLIFAPGEISKTVRVSLVDGAVAEGTEMFWLQLYSPVGAVIEQPLVPATIYDNDAAPGTPALVASDVSVDEGAGTASFFVTLSRPSATPVSVNFGTADDNALAGADYSTTSGLLIFAPGEMVKTVTVSLINDGDTEGDEFFALRLSAPAGASIADGEGVAMIGRNDGGATGSPLVFVTAVTIDDSATFARVAVQLSAPSSTSVTLSLQTDSATATNNSDYQFTRDTLTFAPGQTLKTFHIPLLADTLDEPTELFWVQLYSPVNALLPRPYTLMTLVDNDGTAGTPAISVGDAVVDESAQTARVAVTLSRPSSSTVSVAYATAGDSASAGQDFTAAAGTLTFAPGETTKTVIVKLLDDGLVEPDEAFAVVLSAPTNATLADATGVVTIGRNDGAPVGTPYVYTTPIAVGEGDTVAVMTVRLSAPSSNEVRVSYQTDNDAATANSDFQFTRDTLIFAPGETIKPVYIPLLDGALAEAAASFYLQLYTPVNAVLSRPFTSITVFDNDGSTGTPALQVSDVVVDEGAMSAQFFVWLNKPSTSTVTVAYTTADDNAVAGQDYRGVAGSLSFAPGEVVKTVNVDLSDDALDETDEFFQLVLGSPANATLADAVGTAMIGRSDAPPTSRPYLTVAPVAVSEGSGMAVFAAQLSAPSSNEVKFSYQTDNSTAVANQDFSFSRQQLIFAPGETTQFIEIPILDDTVAEPAQSFYLQLYSLTNATAAVSYIPALIVDNDGTTGTPGLSVSDVAVDENAQGVSFFVSLNRASTQTVTVRWVTVNDTAAAGSDYQAASGTLSFAPGEMVKTVTVKLVDDSLTEALESFQLRLNAPGNATLLDAVGAAFIGRSDGPPVARPQVLATPLTVSEGDTFATWLVQLSAPSNNEVAVNWQTENGTAVANADYVFDRQLVTFAPGETLRTLRLPLLEDTSAESTETLVLRLYSPTNATIAQAISNVSIIDNDSGFTALSQGLSHDTYSVSSVLARIAESPGGGIDTVLASVSYTLPENVENLKLSGGAANGIGNAGNNVFAGTPSNNTFDGQTGIDTAVFSGPRAAYIIAGSLASRSVAGGADGSDTLLAIERLQFADQVLASDTLPGQNTYLAYAMFNAAFDRGPGATELALWTSQLDRLSSTRDLAQAMINYYAPGVPDEALVAHLWGTIVQTPIPLDALALYVGLVGNGTYTQASLLELVATLDLNTVEFTGIVGSTLAMDVSFFPVPG